MRYKIANQKTWRELCAQMSETLPQKGYTLTYAGRGFVTISHPEVCCPLNVDASDIVPEAMRPPAPAVQEATAWLANQQPKPLAYA